MYLVVSCRFPCLLLTVNSGPPMQCCSYSLKPVNSSQHNQCMTPVFLAHFTCIKVIIVHLWTLCGPCQVSFRWRLYDVFHWINIHNAPNMLMSHHPPWVDVCVSGVILTGCTFFITALLCLYSTTPHCMCIPGVTMAHIWWFLFWVFLVYSC